MWRKPIIRSGNEATAMKPDTFRRPAAGKPAAAPAPEQAPAPAVSRRLHVRHETRYAYDAPVELAHHLAYLRPRDMACQTVSRWSLDIVPPPDRGGPHVEAGAALAPAEPCLHTSRDAWGNWRCTFSHSVVHQHLAVVSTFSVDVDPPALLDAQASPPWEAAAARLRYRPGRIDPAEREAVEFSLASSYAPCDAALRAYAQPVFTPGRPLLDAALALMHAIHTNFEYRPQATSVATRAPAALALRQGVCQDFAHVMIGALRSLGLSARYVSGYLLTHPLAGQQRLVGADASHAWVAVWCPLHGWVALDPTNNVPVGQDHVTLAWGRDYGDVAPLRGVIRGSGRAVPLVAVTVAPDADAALVMDTG
jgi:transglutaminase-like putative cysteine protease